MHQHDGVRETSQSGGCTHGCSLQRGGGVQIGFLKVRPQIPTYALTWVMLTLALYSISFTAEAASANFLARTSLYLLRTVCLNLAS